MSSHTISDALAFRKWEEGLEWCMAQGLRSLVALAEDPSDLQLSLTPVSGCPMPSTAMQIKHK